MKKALQIIVKSVWFVIFLAFSFSVLLFILFDDAIKLEMISNSPITVWAIRIILFIFILLVLRKFFVDVIAWVKRLF